MLTNLDDTLKKATKTALRILIYYEKLPIPFRKTPLLLSFL